MASKNVEVANSGKIQAEMDAEKADIEASHVAKIATTKIESVRASAAKGVELAKRRSEVLAAYVWVLKDIVLNLSVCRLHFRDKMHRRSNRRKQANSETQLSVKLRRPLR